MSYYSTGFHDDPPGPVEYPVLDPFSDFVQDLQDFVGPGKDRKGHESLERKCSDVTFSLKSSAQANSQSATKSASTPQALSPKVSPEALNLDNGPNPRTNLGLPASLDHESQITPAQQDPYMNHTRKQTEAPSDHHSKQGLILLENSKSLSADEIPRKSASSGEFLPTRLYLQTNVSETVKASDYVSELCLIIYNELSLTDMVHKMRNFHFRESIPGFAIRIGLESSAQDISNFIYHNATVISGYFDTLCDVLHFHENSSKQYGKSHSKDLSFQAKLRLWGIKSQADLPAFDLSDPEVNRSMAFFSITSMPDLATYHSLIIESASFKWLIDNIMLDQNIVESLSTTRKQFRKAVLDSLPVENLEESQHPKIHEVVFRFEQWSIQDDGGPCPNSNRFFPSLLVTSSSGSALAASLDDYISKIWHSSWASSLFLQLRSCVLSTKVKEEIRAAKFPDGTDVFMSTEGTDITFRVCGPSVTVVDCGDQLAWLYTVSKTAQNDRDIPVEYTPILTNACAVNHKSPDDMYHLNRLNLSRCLPSVCLVITLKEAESASLTEQRKLWSRMLPSGFAVTHDYPRIRQPQGSWGLLELSWSLLLDSVGGTVAVVNSEKQVVLRGSRKSLTLVKSAEDFYFWHETCLFGRVCKCSSDCRRWSESHDFQLEVMKSGRHFVEVCYHRQLSTGDNDVMQKPAPTLDGNTDSGYASRNTDARREEPGTNDSHAPESISEHSNLDAQTSYSILTGVSPNSVHHYVSSLSDSLFHKISKHSDAKSWPSVLKALPRLLKAFAMQIGQEALTQENRYIMWFIHQHHKKIIGRIKAEFSELCEPNVPEGGRPSHEVMPLDEKFHRWNIQIEHSPCRQEESVLNTVSAHAPRDVKDPSQIALREGLHLRNEDEDNPAVPEDNSENSGNNYSDSEDNSESSYHEGQPTTLTHVEEDTGIQVGQQAYEDIVLQSEAYRRLVSGLKNVSALEWEDHLQATHSDEDVQQAILRKLPTGRISSRQGPRVHIAKFWIRRKQLSRDIEPIMEEEKCWIDSIVAIGCGTKAQAISIKSYVFQTWPATGPAILELFQVLIDRSYNEAPISGYFSIVPELRRRFSIVLSDHTGISVTWANINWVFTVTGLAHAVAECGQQLAWIVAAIRSANTEASRQVTPIVVERVRETPVSHGFLSATRAHAVSFELDTRDASAMESGGKSSPESILRGNLPVIHGFPIRRRTVDSSGLEIPGEYLWELSGAHSITTQDNRTWIRGSRITLTLVKHAGDTLLWHRSITTHGPCKCYIDKAVHQDVPYNLSILKEFWHIVDYCTVDESESEASYCSVRSSKFQETRNPSQFFNALQGSSCKSEQAKRQLSSSPNAMYTRCAHQFDNVSEPEYSNSSLDSDLLSMSDSSGEIDLLDDHDALRPLIDILVSHLVAGYRSFTSGDSTSSHNQSTPPSFKCQNATVLTNTTKKAKGKRLQSEGPDSEEEDNRPPPFKKAKLGLSKPFSCPFHKMGPSKHSSCAKYTLNRISRVKQHLLRKHTPAAYCRRCFMIFPSDTSLTQHMSRPQGFHCQIAPPGTRLQGITSDQSKLLSKKSKKELSEQQQWFAIWDVVFPGLERPSSPHPDPGLETEVSAFREYCRGHEEGIIDNLLNSGMVDPSLSEDRRKQLARTALAEGLDELCSQWSPSQLLRPVAPQHITALQTPATSLGDSALSTSNFPSNTWDHPGLFSASKSVSEESQPHSSSDILPSMNKPETLPDSGEMWPDGCQDFDSIPLEPLDGFSIEVYGEMFQGTDELGTFSFDMPEIPHPDIEQGDIN